MAVVEQIATTHRPRAAVVRRARPTSTSSSTTLEQYERGEITPDQWRAFRLVRGTYGQRQAADAQMLRVKIPQGMLTSRAARRARRRRRALLARLRPHHDAAEHPVPFRQAARRRAGDAPARRRGPDDARGVRQLGAQHHGVPVRRRRRRRALRRHAVRRGADALSAAPSAQLDAAAQVQDRVRRLRRAITSRTGDQRPRRSARVLGPDGGARLPRHRRRRHGDHVQRRPALLHEFLPASEILRVAEAVLRVFKRARRLPAQAAQPHEVHDQDARLGRAGARSTTASSTGCRLRGAGADARRSIAPAGEAAPDWVQDASPSVGHIAARVADGRVDGPGHHADVVPVFQPGDEAYARWRATNVRPQKQFGYVMAIASVPLGDLTSEQMRVLGDLARAYGDGTSASPPDQNLRVSLGATRATCAQLYRRLAAAGPRAGRSGHDRRRDQLPGRGDRAGWR